MSKKESRSGTAKSKTGGGLADEGGNTARQPASYTISRQLDQEKIDFLTQRIDQLLSSNNELRTGASQNERDTHDIVLYFQREMEIKDDIILRLNEELVKCQTQLKFEVEKMRKVFEDELATAKLNAATTISSQETKIAQLEGELKSIDMFRREKDAHDEMVARLERQLQQQRDQLIDAMEEQERRFLEEKAQLYKDLEAQKVAFREVALREARQAMGEDVKKILNDNARMTEELKFHHGESVTFQTEKSLLTSELNNAKRELNILMEKEIEYAKQAYNRSKEVKILREKVMQLEKQQALTVEKFKSRAKEIKSTVTKELEEATLDAAGLRRLIYIKNQELKHMKSLAATILSQRTETEQFFLESLNEVKEVIREERKRKAATAAALIGTIPTNNIGTFSGKTNINKGNGIVTFPPLNIKPANMHLLDSRRKQPEIPLDKIEKVTISELSWEDKELVLRVLFAKMNSAGPQGTNNGASAYSGVNEVPMPVFISEGAEMPDHDDMGMAMNHFEVQPKNSGLVTFKIEESPSRFGSNDEMDNHSLLSSLEGSQY